MNDLKIISVMIHMNLIIIGEIAKDVGVEAQSFQNHILMRFNIKAFENLLMK